MRTIELSDEEYIIIREWLFNNNVGLPNSLAIYIASLQDKFKESPIQGLKKSNGEMSTPIKNRVN